jgi:hypothetical protein
MLFDSYYHLQVIAERFLFVFDLTQVQHFRSPLWGLGLWAVAKGHCRLEVEKAGYVGNAAWECGGANLCAGGRGMAVDRASLSPRALVKKSAI